MCRGCVPPGRRGWERDGPRAVRCWVRSWLWTRWCRARTCRVCCWGGGGSGAWRWRGWHGALPWTRWRVDRCRCACVARARCIHRVQAVACRCLPSPLVSFALHVRLVCYPVSLGSGRWRCIRCSWSGRRCCLWPSACLPVCRASPGRLASWACCRSCWFPALSLGSCHGIALPAHVVHQCSRCLGQYGRFPSRLGLVFGLFVAVFGLPAHQVHRCSSGVTGCSSR